MAETNVSDILNDVPHVEQQKANFCGPACCQMFAAKYSVPVLQPEAFSRIAGVNTEPPPLFWTDPRAIATVLNDYVGASLGFTLADFSASTMEELLQKLYFTMNILKAPCIILISKGMHWIVIDGFREQVSANGDRGLLGAWVEDPWFGRPEGKYLTMTELIDKGIFSPVDRGVKWLNKYVFLTRSEVRDILDPVAFRELTRAGLIDNAFLNKLFRSAREADLLFKPKIVTPELAGGGGAGVEAVALQSLELNGFQAVRPIDAGGGAPVISPITVNDLIAGNTYEIVPLDATRTTEFGEYVYAALESGGQQRLLEVERMRFVLDAFSDEEAVACIEAIFPGAVVNLEAGYFWQRGRHFKSRFQVARRFKVDERTMYLLPNGLVDDTLSEPEVYG